MPVELLNRVDADGAPFRLLHVHAHPDDESSKGAATTAKYVSEGVRVVVATCTGGERGSILNPKLQGIVPEGEIAEVRRGEMARAREILGIEQVWLGFVDSGFPEGDPPPPLPEGCFALEDVDEAAGRLVKVIRDLRPHVVTTYDERGGYPHPDHVMCHKISMAAVDAAADPDRWPEHGEPWVVKKVYYQMSFHRRRYAELDRLMHERGLPSPYAERLRDWTEDELGPRLTTFIPCADYFEVRDAALLAHATQVDPDGSWFAVPLEIQQLGWPTEDYQLVRSTVDVHLPETDLFAGLYGPGDDDGTWSYSI
ncbi:mycothiol conjugate amidase Mca [Propionicicella superfundia]|uniref:mycothiol conjugate amidase Mca n=1 Tax=Propionicicella superfundia TaxID=348582 RepID=UPI0003FE2EC4|nr:mycothiol conjugate amidase Mca [Propionicicella superfundia]